MDEIEKVVLYDAETDSETEFDLTAECTLNDKEYYLIVEPESAETAKSSESAEKETELAAYVFVECTESEAEFTMTLDGEKIFITSMMSDDDYYAAVKVFMASDEYDLELDDLEE